MKKISNLVLASSSPRRLYLLERMGLRPGLVVKPKIDESYYKKELPKDFSIRMSKAKAQAVHSMYPDMFILSADTVVSVGRRILDKTNDEEQVRNNIKLISGRRHRVYTTICLYTPTNTCHMRTVITYVKFKRLSMQELDFYISTMEWKGMAGGYSIQGIAGMFVIWLRGSYTSVMGLPIYEVYCLLSNYFKKEINTASFDQSFLSKDKIVI